GLCGNSTRYATHRRQLGQAGTTSITVLVPTLLSLLKAPPELAGVAIVLSLFVATVGVDALCDTLNEVLTPAGARPATLGGRRAPSLGADPARAPERRRRET